VENKVIRYTRVWKFAYVGNQEGNSMFFQVKMKTVLYLKNYYKNSAMNHKIVMKEFFSYLIVTYGNY